MNLAPGVSHCVFEGSGTFRDASGPQGVLTELQVNGEEVVAREVAADRSLVLFDRGDEVVVTAGPTSIRFLLISGRPIEEPVAWYGPIVMTTRGRAADGGAGIEQWDVYQA